MVNSRLGLSAYALAAMLVGCSGNTQDVETDDNLGTVRQAIVGPSALGGPDQVVMVYATALTSSGLITRTCSGSCFAPRVVLTAAHCLSDIYEGQLFVYYGDDFEGDFEQLVPWGDLLMIPEPGQPSTWAQADSFETHPEWDPNLLYPDMGVIYLDRALPFEPLPLARFR